MINNKQSVKFGLRQINSFWLFVFDVLLIAISFLTVTYLRLKTFHIGILYLKLLITIYLGWIIVFLFIKKRSLLKYPTVKKITVYVLSSGIFTTFIVSFAISINGLYGFSRGQALGTIGLFTLLELIGLWAYTVIAFGADKKNIKKEYKKSESVTLKKFSASLFVNDIILLVFSFFVINYYKRGAFELTDKYQSLFWVVAGIWLVVSMFTNKFNKFKLQKYIYVVEPYLKAYVLMMLLTSTLIFFFRLFYFSRMYLFGTFTVMIIAEIVSSYLNFMTWVREPQTLDVEDSKEAVNLIKQEMLTVPKEYKLVNQLTSEESVRESIKNNQLSKFPAVFDFVDKNVDLQTIKKDESFVVETNNMYNIEIINNSSLSLFMNLRKVNGLKRLNRYFLEVHKKIKVNGLFISSVETNEIAKEQLFKNMTKYIAIPMYIFQFVFHRVFPKLPILKYIYFTVSRRENRALSKAETFGRLCFCGFEIVAEEKIGNRLYFVAKRVKYPSKVTNPSYGPVIKLSRICMNGEVKQIYKLRTMHPYSEFLREYVYHKNKLTKEGKIKDDFRLTEWGKFIRKFWIDELPQFINYLRGDLTLVGVRALSLHHFSLFPKDLQELRVKFKPGIIPPYYADLPETFEEIFVSERQYLKRKENAPIRTDIVYFFKAMYNIIIKRAHSK